MTLYNTDKKINLKSWDISCQKPVYSPSCIGVTSPKNKFWFPFAMPDLGSKKEIRCSRHGTATRVKHHTQLQLHFLSEIKKSNLTKDYSLRNVVSYSNVLLPVESLVLFFNKLFIFRIPVLYFHIIALWIWYILGTSKEDFLHGRYKTV